MITRAVIVFLVLLFAAGCWLAWRLIGTGKGQHAAPRGFTEADERLASTAERVIPRAVTEHPPPWEPAPAAGPATEIIEPAAVTHGPPPGPEPVTDAIVIATGTVTGGRLHSVRAAVLAPPPAPVWPGELHPKVAELLGYPSVDDALASMYRRADALKLRELLDGAS